MSIKTCKKCDEPMIITEDKHGMWWTCPNIRRLGCTDEEPATTDTALSKLNGEFRKLWFEIKKAVRNSWWGNKQDGS